MSAIETTREIAIPSGTWTVDPSHSRVEFSIRHRHAGLCHVIEPVPHTFALQAILRVAEAIEQMGSSLHWQLLHVITQRERFRRGKWNQHAATGGAAHPARNGLTRLDGMLNFQLCGFFP